MGKNIQLWRTKRGLSAPDLAKKAGLSPESIESLEAGNLDPPASMLNAIAEAFSIPVSWLYGDPGLLEALAPDDSETAAEEDPVLRQSVDPVLDHILRAKPVGRKLFHLLALLIHSGEEKQIRAAEVSLRSLIKQTRNSVIPWENRQPGNFDPPSD